MVAAKVASLILGRQSQTGHSKYQLKGSRTEVANQSVPYAATPVRNYVFQQFGNQSGNFFPFLILADRFYLVYDSYSGNKETTRLYELAKHSPITKSMKT